MMKRSKVLNDGWIGEYLIIHASHEKIKHTYLRGPLIMGDTSCAPSSTICIAVYSEGEENVTSGLRDLWTCVLTQASGLLSG
jgi:hypothetical protein